ncbi:MAG: ribose-phosphate diphosphokinase [Acidobacteriota bacterium]
MTPTEPLLFAASHHYRPMAAELVALGGLELGRLEQREFPDGERYQRLLTPVAGRRVVVLAGTIDDTATLTLYDLAYTVVKAGAMRLTLVIPYFGYSTMERMEHEGEVVTAKARARLLSSLPPAHHGNDVLLLDLHTGGLPHYFEDSLTPVHLSARSIVLEQARLLGGEDCILACTDAGRAKWVESLANDLGTTAAFVFKQRLDGSTTRITAVSAAVAGRRVVIYDDMIRTGGSLIDAARAYREAGATRVSAIATHGLFPGEAAERLRECGLFDHIVCTDSHPRPRQVAEGGGFLRVLSLAPLLHRALTATEPGPTP